MKLVVDASAVLAVILGEIDKDKVVHETNDCDLISPSCLPWEVGNAFSACLKRKKFELDDLEVAWEAFHQIQIQLSDVDIFGSLRIAEQYHLYAYDCYYLQCAIAYKLPILSLDNRMLQVAKELKLRTVEIP